MNTPINNDWTTLVPPYDSQYSASTHTDFEDCVEESLCHIVYCLTGFRPSPRALGKFVGVSPTLGSDTFNALAETNSKGLIPFQEWPTPTDTSIETWEVYYQGIPSDVLAWALPVEISLVPPDISKSPLWTRLVFPDGAAHYVCQINSHQYFDSETGNPIKELTYDGAIVTTSMGIQVSDNFFLKSSGFTPEQFANLSVPVQLAIKANDAGGKNIILGTNIINQQ